jgi:hypothetical protein
MKSQISIRNDCLSQSALSRPYCPARISIVLPLTAVLPSRHHLASLAILLHACLRHCLALAIVLPDSIRIVEGKTLLIINLIR